MDTALQRIRAKINELETKIAGLRIAEHKLQALEKPAPRRSKQTPKPGPKPKRVLKKASEPVETRGTIGSAISAVLEQHGALSAAEIAERIRATDGDISNRTVSFTLQALKKRGLVKNVKGQWTPPRPRSRRASA